MLARPHESQLTTPCSAARQSPAPAAWGELPRAGKPYGANTTSQGWVDILRPVPCSRNVARGAVLFHFQGWPWSSGIGIFSFSSVLPTTLCFGLDIEIK